MNKSIWIAVVVLAVLGLGAFFVLGQQKSSQPEQVAATPAPTDIPTMEEPSGSAPATSTGSGVILAVKEFTVESSPFKFVPNTINVKMGDHVKITLTNGSGMHNFVIDELNVKSKMLSTAGATDVIEFVASKKGTFKYYCSVPGHRAKGMEGTLTVE